jgi:hypothetical protein
MNTELAQALMSNGVTDENWLWWQNLDSEEKEKIKEEDANFRMAYIDTCMQEMQLSKNDAILKAMKTYVFYEEYPIRQGILDTIKKLGLSENDYPLPYELHSRIDKFLISLMMGEIDQNDFQRQVGYFSTMNALFRHKIKSGDV